MIIFYHKLTNLPLNRVRFFKSDQFLTNAFYYSCFIRFFCNVNTEAQKHYLSRLLSD